MTARTNFLLVLLLVAAPAAAQEVEEAIIAEPLSTEPPAPGRDAATANTPSDEGAAEASALQEMAKQQAAPLAFTALGFIGLLAVLALVLLGSVARRGPAHAKPFHDDGRWRKDWTWPKGPDGKA